MLGVQSFQERLRDDDGIDISTGSDFHGLMTFANLPYTNCFKESHNDDTLEGDIFLLGAPFDTVSVSPIRLVEVEVFGTGEIRIAL